MARRLILISLCLSQLFCSSPKGKSIVVNLAKQQMFCMEGQKTIYTFPVSTGKDGSLTPTGNFEIYTKTLNAVNKSLPDIVELGPAMHFEHEHLFAIHGWPRDRDTREWLEKPEDIGHKRLSDGRIMLLRPDMDTVYHWADIGTPLVIRAD